MPGPDSTLNSPSLPLLNILKNQVLPLWEHGGMERCLIAPHDLTNERALQKWLSTGASISSAPYKGKRVVVKGPRGYANRSTNQAFWPDDQLQECKVASLVIVINGKADFQIADQMTRCSAGHSILVLPGVPRSGGKMPHLTEKHREHGFCDLLWLSGESGAGLACWICHSEGNRHFERPGESCYIPAPDIWLLFELFLREATARGEGFREICQYLLQSLLLAVYREIRQNDIFLFNYQKTGSPDKNSAAQKVQDPMSGVHEYIRNHLHEPLHIDEVATRFYFSRSNFTRRFKRETGHTFNEYLTLLRLEEAKHLLADTDWPVETIGQRVGFNSSRLRVLFNRHYGISPQQYRKQCINSNSN